MTYDEANSALHALRDAGYDGIALWMTKDFYTNTVGDPCGVAVFGEILTSDEIDRMIAEAEKDESND